MLVTMEQILQKATEEAYAVVAPNVFSEFDARTYLEAAEDLASPIILDVADPCTPDIVFLGRILVRLAEQASIPVAIHLDHGANFTQVMKAVRGGFTSVMMDASSLPYEDNIACVRSVVEAAAPLNISVEAELGHVGAGASYGGEQALTDPMQAREFISRTGIHALAVSIGTAHGAYRGSPKIDFDRLCAIKEYTGGFPLVLHGSSGTGDENIQKACRLGINKVNVCSDMLKAAYQKIHCSDLMGDAVYEIWSIMKEAFSEEIRHQISLAGSEGKSGFYPPVGLTRAQITMRE